MHYSVYQAFVLAPPPNYWNAWVRGYTCHSCTHTHMPAAVSRIIIFMCFDSFWDKNESHNHLEGKLNIKAASEGCCLYIR